MKHVRSKILLGVLLGLASSSCAPQPGPFFISRFYPITACNPSDAPDGVFAKNGFLDVGPGSPAFMIGVEIEGQAVQPATIVNGIEMEAANRNKPLVQEIVVSYKLSRSLGATPKPFVTNASFALEGLAHVGAQLISPELGQLLVDGLSPARDLSDTVDIDAAIEFRGIYSGSAHPFTTGTSTYPIRAYKSGDCTVTPVDCLYPGQSTSQTFGATMACP